MTTNTKKLAEFAAEFLNLLHVQDFYFFPSGSDHCFTIQDSQVEDYFFHNSEYAPILAYLAKREMEKRGFDCEYNRQLDQHRYEFDLSLDYDRPIARGESNSEYIALWSAIEEAVKK